MLVIVYEKDPLVQQDIVETLTAEIPSAVVRSTDREQDLRQWIKQSKDRCLVVISVPMKSDPSVIADLAGAAGTVGSVVIGNAPRGALNLPSHSYYIQRPFSSEWLVKGVKTVLSAQPVHPS